GGSSRRRRPRASRAPWCPGACSTDSAWCSPLVACVAHAQETLGGVCGGRGVCGCACGQPADGCAITSSSCELDVDNYSRVTTRCSGNRTSRPQGLASERAGGNCPGWGARHITAGQPAAGPRNLPSDTPTRRLEPLTGPANSTAQVGVI